MTIVGSGSRCQRPLSVVALALTQGVQLCLVQSLRDVRDQIRRVFDADRQPDRGVENAYFLAESAGTPEWVMLAGRLASDSVPPRLTASLKICSAFKNLN